MSLKLAAVMNEKSSLDYFFSELENEKILTREQESALYSALENGCSKARDKLVRANLRIAMKYAHIHFKKHPKLSFEDIVQEAMLGLSEAVDKFDTRRGCRFNTYCFWYIKKNLEDYSAKNTHIWYVPKSVYYLRNKVNTIDNRDLDNKEIAENLGVSESRVSDVRKYDNFLSDTSNIAGLSRPEKDLFDDEFIDMHEDEDSFTDVVHNEILIDFLLAKADDLLDNIEQACFHSVYASPDSTGITRKKVAEALGIQETDVARAQKLSVEKIQQAVYNDEDLASKGDA